jgi:anti-sigma factor RsiW
MSGHLEDREINGWVLGERPAGVERHLAGCPECHAEVVRLERALQGFRGAIHTWSDSLPAPRPARFTGWMPSFRSLCLASATLLLIVTTISTVPAPPPPAAANSQVTDVDLLKQVDREVSRTVPSSMEPLMTLVAWESSATAGVPVQAKRK